MKFFAEIAGIAEVTKIVGIAAIAGAIFLLTALSGCAPSKTDISRVFSYNFSLVNPPTGTLSFEDDDKNLRFTFSPERDYMKVVFINKSARPVKVFWEEALYVDKDGLSHTLVAKNAGHKDSDSKKPQEPATIAPGAQLTEWLMPRDNIRPGLIGSRVEPMFPRLSNPVIIDSWDRTAFKITLPLEVNGEAKTYEFEFRVKTR